MNPIADRMRELAREQYALADVSLADRNNSNIRGHMYEGLLHEVEAARCKMLGDKLSALAAEVEQCMISHSEVEMYRKDKGYVCLPNAYLAGCYSTKGNTTEYDVVDRSNGKTIGHGRTPNEAWTNAHEVATANAANEVERMMR